MLCLHLEWEFLGASIGIQTRHGSSVDAAVQVLNALAPCQQEQGDLSGAEAMLRSSVILAKHQQDLTSQVTSCQHPLCIIILSFHYMKIPTAVDTQGHTLMRYGPFGGRCQALAGRE